MSSVSPLRPFHLAVVVNDLGSARSFYGGLLGCREGRSSAEWVDFDFFGHQLVCHLGPPPAGDDDSAAGAHCNVVDGHGVPVPHFGAVLDMPTFDRTRARLVSSGVKFIVEPHVRFRDQPGEQATMFLADPAGNHIEFKAFANLDQLFAR